MVINQPTWTTQSDNSKTKTARPEFLFITEMLANTGGDALAIIERTCCDALQAGLNRIPGSCLLVLHGLLIQLKTL